MPKLDIIHNVVKNTLIKDGWVITDDLYIIQYRKTTLYADLGADVPQAKYEAVYRFCHRMMMTYSSYSD